MGTSGDPSPLPTPTLSEIQGCEVPKVTVEEVSDALALIQAKVIVEGLVRRGQADELLGEEAGEVLPHLFQERVGSHQWRQALLVHRDPQASHPGQQRFWGDGGALQEEKGGRRLCLPTHRERGLVTPPTDPLPTLFQAEQGLARVCSRRGRRWLRHCGHRVSSPVFLPR